VSLTDAFTSFLRSRRKDDLVAALGNRLEGRLLAQWSGGTHAADADGTRAWIGPALPSAAEPYDLWLDAVELMPMVLVPRPDVARMVGWVATRPVERWQFGAFLAVARIRARRSDLFDRARILDGPETTPVTRVIRDEAELYARWFGKLLPSRPTWELVSEARPEDDLATRWSLTAEWDDEAYEGANGVVTPGNLYLDPLGEDGGVPVFSAGEAPENITFRTLVHAQFGLIDRLARAPEIEAELRDLAPRDHSYAPR
jgi:hypothetical protein